MKITLDKKETNIPNDIYPKLARTNGKVYIQYRYKGAWISLRTGKSLGYQLYLPYILNVGDKIILEQE